MDLERNAEIVRQWKILRQVASAATWTVNKLMAEHDVCRRTIYRDLAALQNAGFPLYDERVDRTVYWRMSPNAFKGFSETAFTLSELCAFYVNRARFAATGGSPVDEDYQSALTKLTRALSPKMREYLDKVASVMVWKAEANRHGAASAEAKYRDMIVNAALEHRRLAMTYHSFSSQRTRRYCVEPYRLVLDNGSLYLFGYVPEYGQMRTFAVQRIRELQAMEERFSPVLDVAHNPFEGSLGPFTGATQDVSIAFDSTIAAYVREHEWHETQALTERSDGSVVMRLRVCVDPALRTWILGFGHHARVLKPSTLAETILEELEEAREQYAPRMPFELPQAIHDDRQFVLPFLPPRTGSRPGTSPRHGKKPTGALYSSRTRHADRRG